MNNMLSEINEILDLCDAMIRYIKERGEIQPGNGLYQAYKTQIYAFLKGRKLMREDFAPYQVLSQFYYRGANYTVHLNEAQMLRTTVAALQHSLFPNYFESIFISHREKDQRQVGALIELLYCIGIPRPTAARQSCIFCTSHPATYIANGERNMEEIRSRLTSDNHTFYILWYTDHYFESQACLNEAGAIWAMGKKYQEILAPGFSGSKIGGLLDKQAVWFQADNKFRLNTFKEQLESMFCLESLSQNAWETARDRFLEQLAK